MNQSNNPESSSFHPVLQDPLGDIPYDFHDIQDTSSSTISRRIPSFLQDCLRLFKNVVILVSISLYLNNFLRPENLYRLQDHLGFIDPISRTSTLFPPPLISGPYQLADLESIKESLEAAEENLETLQSAIRLVENQFRDLKLRPQPMRRMLPFIDVDNGDKIADALSTVINWGFAESEPRIELARDVEDVIQRCTYFSSVRLQVVNMAVIRMQHPDLSFQSHLHFMWFAFKAGIHAHPSSGLVELEIASRLMVPLLHDLTLIGNNAKSAIQVLDIPLLRRTIASLNGDLSVALDTLATATYLPLALLPIETQTQMLTSIQREMVALERGLETMMDALANLDRIREEVIALGRDILHSSDDA
ncbi:hypothetical protein NLI96_g7760 [Meripilus lineatus]|uniref:Uncharacterized protein n=1 Tax=Meripilus lineatus TaxID=2056292 RepID=A0AAD5YBR4_9APHY|nr:hypothetical protein NLI96_g7760 [Physisporinus lineatus]